MKKLFACLFAIIILVINVIPCFAATSSLSLSASDYSINISEPITMTVSLSGETELTALTFDIKYNPDEFSYVAGSKSTGKLFESEYVDNSSAGTIRYDGVSTGSTVKGGTAISVQFRAKKHSEGKVGGKISVSGVTATDANNEIVRLSGSSASLNCDHSALVWKEKTASTCTSTGVDEGKCSCGYSTTRVSEKKPHMNTSSKVTKPATCTEPGVQVGTCTICGAEDAKSPIPARGHSYSEWTVKQAATVDTMGIKERFCTNCGDVQSQTIPTLIEGINPEDITQEEESSTETTTEFEPIFTPEPSTDNQFEYETEVTTESNGIFNDAVGSDIALIVVIALAILVVIVLVMYIVLIIRQKKR